MSSEEKTKFDAKAFALNLRKEIEQNQIKLPTLPTLSLEALLVVNDAESSMADIARVISKDTSMAARLVRYANSPLYRGISSVASVKAAITRIGIDAVKHAILSLAMRDVFTTAYRSIQLRMEALWKHSVRVAAISVLLADHYPHINRDEAMLAGLIHDVGAIPILIKAKDYPLLLEDERKLDKLIQVLHMNIGWFMLSHWNFDASMIDVASQHDKLDRQPAGAEVDLVDIVQAANILSRDDPADRPREIDRSQVTAFKRIAAEWITGVEEKIASGEDLEIGSMLH